MNEEFYIGQIFEGTYPPAAACWCNSHNAYIEKIGERRYEIKAIPEPLPPTDEEQRQNRANAYKEEIDPLHAQKMRHTILGDWTEEDEANYVAEVKRLSEEINNRFPYMENSLEINK